MDCFFCGGIVKRRGVHIWQKFSKSVLKKARSRDFAFFERTSVILIFWESNAY